MAQNKNYYNTPKVSKDGYDLANRLIRNMMLALEGTLREDFGFGDKRIDQISQGLNKRLPDSLQLNIEMPERVKIKQSQLYDLTELLLELNCSVSCTKSFNSCKLYNAMVLRDIPPYDEEAVGCPYKVKPGKHTLSAEDIQRLKDLIYDRYRRNKKY